MLPPPPWSLQAWMMCLALLLAATLASPSATLASLSPSQTTSLVATPICRFTTRPCVRLVNRNASEIIAPPTSVPLLRQYAIYSPLTSTSTCPTNHSICVPSTAYTPTLSRLPSGAVNVTISLLDSDLPPESSLFFTLSSSAFLYGPPCGSGVCNATVWSMPSPLPPSSPVITFVVANATGTLNAYRNDRIALSSMALMDSDVLAASSAEFSPTVSFESDPTCMRLSFSLPRSPAISSLSLCLALNSRQCPFSLPSSFQSLSANDTKPTVLQGSASLRVAIANASDTSLCLALSWDPNDVAALQTPLGLAFPSVHLANATAAPSSSAFALPASVQWTVQGTAAQCVPIVYLDSPRSGDVLEPKTLWTVVSLVLYTFGFVVACLLVRLHGVSFVKQSLFNDVAHVAVLLVFICSLLLHVVWLTILHRLAGAGSSTVETGFLVAILEGLRETVLWTFLVSVCAHWMVLSWPCIGRHHRETGRVVAAWCAGLVAHFLVLLLYVVQNYSVMKCTYVDYLRNTHRRAAPEVGATNATMQHWLPLLQPAEWKYGVNKVCVDSGGGFLYTFAPLHVLPLGMLVLLLRLGCTRLHRHAVKKPLYACDHHLPLTASESRSPPQVEAPSTAQEPPPHHHTLARGWMLTGTSAMIVIAFVTTLGLHHGLMLYLYATSQHMPSLVWLVVGEYLPMLVPTLGYLALQWTTGWTDGPQRSARQPPRPSKRYGRDAMDDGEAHALLTPTSPTASIAPFADRHPTLAHIAVHSDHPVVVQLFVSVLADPESWTPLGEALNGPQHQVVTPWRPQAQLRCVVTTRSPSAPVESACVMGSLWHAPHRVALPPMGRDGETAMLSEDPVVTVSLVRLDNAVSRPVAVATTHDDRDLHATEVLKESAWPTLVAIAYVQSVVPTVQRLADQAAADLAAFDSQCRSTSTAHHPIDRIQDEAEAENVRSWLVQRRDKRAEYAAMLTAECLPAMAHRLEAGAWAKLTADAKASALRYLLLNLHVHELHVASSGAVHVHSTLTSGVLTTHSAARLPRLSCDGDDDASTPWPSHVRSTDEVAWSNWVRETEANGQALATLVTAAVDHLNRSVAAWQEWVATSSFVLHVESVLSDHGKERPMIHDCAAAMEWLHTHVTLGLQVIDAPDHAPDAVVDVQLHHPTPPSDPSMTADDKKVHVVLRVARPHWPAAIETPSGAVVAVTALLFTQGINEAQTLANKTGGLFKETYPDVVNQRSADRLAEYIDRHIDRLSPECVDVVRGKLAALKQSILQAKRERVKKKHPEILQVSAHISRLIGAGRVTVCATGKERAAMAVTLEHGWVLGHFHHVPAPSVRRAVAAMRSEGVRLDVLDKNGGRRQYSFTALQRSMLPEAYRCPEGTYDTSIA